MNDGHDDLDEPTESVVAGLVEAAAGAGVPDAALVAVRGADRPASGPRVGELWRASQPGGGPITVVWVRSVRSTEVVVVPVSLDVELADDATLIVPGDASPLGLPLAIHLGLEAAVDRATLRDRLASLDIATLAVMSGPAIVSPLDERIEYREGLADCLAELALDPGSREPAGPRADVRPEEWWPVETGSQEAELIIAIHQALAASHPSARVTPRPPTAAVPSQVRAVAHASELDAFVLVALVDRPRDERALLDAARQLLDGDPLLNAVCLVDTAAPFASVVIDRRDVVEAIETPSGELRPPRQSRARSPVGDALVKFLDAAITPFGRLASTVVDAQAIDSRGLAVDVSAEAVRAVAASARGYKVQGKRPGYERVTRHQASITRLVEQALNRGDVDVASMLEDDV